MNRQELEQRKRVLCDQARACATADWHFPDDAARARFDELMDQVDALDAQLATAPAATAPGPARHRTFEDICREDMRAFDARARDRRAESGAGGRPRADGARLALAATEK